MKTSELHGMSDDVLALTLTDTEKHLFQLRFQSATDRLETPSEIKKAKRDIARIKTEQHRRVLAKMLSISDEQLATTIADLHTKTEEPGKRRVKRTIHRYETILASRESKKTTAALPAKGK